MQKSPTFDDVMRNQGPHATGFDYLRVGLAIGVLFVHVAVIADHDFWVSLWTSWFGPIERSLLPAFFVLSGFLVSGSLLRNSLPKFVALRAIRILPALAVEVALSAILIGFFFTKLKFSDYVGSPEFRSYFLNIVGSIHFTLPGVFDGRKLNEQLWTIPYEFECYFVLAMLALVGLMRRRDILAVILLSGTLSITIVTVHFDLVHEGWNVPPRVMVIAFLYGVLGYNFRTYIPYNRILFFASLVATYAGLHFSNLVYLALIPLTYITVYAGLMKLPKIPFGDLSYGIYLFHYPIAVCIFELADRTLAWEYLLPMTIFASAIFAALSWRFVEKPALDRKSSLLTWVDAASKWSTRHFIRGIVAKPRATP